LDAAFTFACESRWHACAPYGPLIEPLAANYGGRLCKTTGDGFLAAFASAVQALRCAITIQERLRANIDRLRLRIGVHQGKVVADGDDLLGDGVIIAARLEPLAEPGGHLHLRLLRGATTTITCSMVRKAGWQG